MHDWATWVQSHISTDAWLSYVSTKSYKHRCMTEPREHKVHKTDHLNKTDPTFSPIDGVFRFKSYLMKIMCVQARWAQAQPLRSDGSYVLAWTFSIYLSLREKFLRPALDYGRCIMRFSIWVSYTDCVMICIYKTSYCCLFETWQPMCLHCLYI